MIQSLCITENNAILLIVCMVREGVTTRILNTESMSSNAQTHAPAVLSQGKRLGIQGMGGWVMVREEGLTLPGIELQSCNLQPFATLITLGCHANYISVPLRLIKTYSR
jgi:hypothetical protein